MGPKVSKTHIQATGLIQLDLVETPTQSSFICIVMTFPLRWRQATEMFL